MEKEHQHELARLIDDPHNRGAYLMEQIFNILDSADDLFLLPGQLGGCEADHLP